MDKAHHILVVDGINELSSNIAFLLKLAGFKVSVFADELEACNWLLQQGPAVDSPQMLLLNNPKAERSLYALLFQMRQRFKQLELVFSAALPLQLTGQIVELDPPVHQCRPSEIHNLTRQIFKPAEDPATDFLPTESSPQNSGPGRAVLGRTKAGLEQQ